MKKYVQISIVLLFFGLLVLLKQFYGSDDKKSTTGSSQTSSLRESISPQPTQISSAKYKDGTYTGPVTDAFYGNVQVQVAVSGGKITDVQFLQAPNDNPTTRQINAGAIPILRQEAITAQSAHVDIVTSASQTSEAFIQSLSSALQQAS